MDECGDQVCHVLCTCTTGIGKAGWHLGSDTLLHGLLQDVPLIPYPTYHVRD